MDNKISQNRYSDWVIAVLFVFSLFIPMGFWLVQGDESFSEAEKRSLQDLPKLSVQSATTWCTAFDGYYQDHFGLREWLIHRYQREMSKRFGVSGVAVVIEGQEGWLYLADGDILDDFKGQLRFSDKEKRAFWQQLKTRQEWLKQQGSAYLFMIAPNKQSIYPEYLPEYFQELRGPSRLDDLLSAMPLHEMGPLLDIRKRLVVEKSDVRLYDRTDTHWNLRGAHMGYLALMEETGRQTEELRFTALFEEESGGDLARLMGQKESRIEQSPLFETNLFSAVLREIEAPFAEMLALPQLNVVRTTKANRDMRVLVLHDSFFERLKPMVSETYGEVLYVWRYYDNASMRFITEDKLRQLVDLYKPDLVIEELVERNLPHYWPEPSPTVQE